MTTAAADPRGPLVELAVTDLGIIEHVRLLFGPGMTALTGETGAGKTLLVEAIELLLGGRADPALVRHGAAEAVVEGRFVVDDDDLVLRRVVPVDGRSRAYINGRMATAAELGAATSRLVDLHGQHAHQSLLSARVQRDSLDRHAGIDLSALEAAVADRRRISAELASLGGDAGARAREADLLRYQLAELAEAAIAEPNEDEALDRLEDELADSVAHRAAAATVVGLLTDDGGATDLVAGAVAAIDGREPFASHLQRLRSLHAELADVAGDIRAAGEAIDEDPAHLATVRERRQFLVELRRKYGTAPLDDGRRGAGTLGDVMAFEAAARARLAVIEGHDARAAELDRTAAEADAAWTRAAASVGAARRKAAAGLAQAVQAHLAELAMPDARIEVRVDGADPGDDVQFLLAANRGSDPAPLAKVASGGELARTMLALRLVLSTAPPVLVFDEVDAGIGGQAAIAVGRSLAALGSDHQVLVVTHLPQVGAFADGQLSVRKAVRRGVTVATVTAVEGPERVVELSRMLAGAPESVRVQEAADELLERAARERGR